MTIPHLFTLLLLLLLVQASETHPNTLIPLVLGADLGTESARVGIFSLKGDLVKSVAITYPTTYPKPGFAEQNPSDWYDCLGMACREAIASLRSTHSPHYNIIGMCVDTTACSVVALDGSFQPLRPCLLWCDQRSALQCEEILLRAKGDPALRVNCDGEGPLSAEWMIPKALWLKQHEIDLWNKATYICEKQDFINHKLTGRLCASACNAAARWHWDSEKACRSSVRGADEDGEFPGRPVSLLRRIGLSDLLQKWPCECVAMGFPVGSLTAEAAAHLGLNPGTPVIQGGPDAYVGLGGMGCVSPGQLTLITGSSHLHLAVCDDSTAAPARGVWGPYRGAPLLGLQFAEGGQSSTGSSLAWLRRLLNTALASAVASEDAQDVKEAKGDTAVGGGGAQTAKGAARSEATSSNDAKQQMGKQGRGSKAKTVKTAVQSLLSWLVSPKRPPSADQGPLLLPAPAAPALPSTVGTKARLLSYGTLDAMAARVTVGSGGLLALETFQGQRTPVTDAKARGAFLGLTLAHGPAHLWRAQLEAVCYGTRAAVDALTAAGIVPPDCRQMSVAGGATRSPFFLQMHADVTGLAVVTGETDNAPMLGAAVLAAVGAGAFDDDDEPYSERSGEAEGQAAAVRRRVWRAVGAMVRRAKMLAPDQGAHKAYGRVYGVYRRSVEAVREVSHLIAGLAEGRTEVKRHTEEGQHAVEGQTMVKGQTEVEGQTEEGQTEEEVRTEEEKTVGAVSEPSQVVAEVAAATLPCLAGAAQESETGLCEDGDGLASVGDAEATAARETLPFSPHAVSESGEELAAVNESGEELAVDLSALSESGEELAVDLSAASESGEELAVDLSAVELIGEVAPARALSTAAEEQEGVRVVDDGDGEAGEHPWSLVDEVGGSVEAAEAAGCIGDAVDRQHEQEHEQAERQKEEQVEAAAAWEREEEVIQEDQEGPAGSQEEEGGTLLDGVNAEASAWQQAARTSSPSSSSSDPSEVHPMAPADADSRSVSVRIASPATLEASPAPLEASPAPLEASPASLEGELEATAATGLADDPEAPLSAPEEEPTSAASDVFFSFAAAFPEEAESLALPDSSLAQLVGTEDGNGQEKDEEGQEDGTKEDTHVSSSLVAGDSAAFGNETALGSTTASLSASVSDGEADPVYHQSSAAAASDRLDQELTASSSSPSSSPPAPAPAATAATDDEDEDDCVVQEEDGLSHALQRDGDVWPESADSSEPFAHRPSPQPTAPSSSSPSACPTAPNAAAGSVVPTPFSASDGITAKIMAHCPALAESLGKQIGEAAESAFVEALDGAVKNAVDNTVVMPSILAADFGWLAQEAQDCVAAGAQWLHVDVCDGSPTCSGELTLGPQAVSAIHLHAPELQLDVHVVSQYLRALIAPLARAGATRLTFQYELAGSPKRQEEGWDETKERAAAALSLALEIRQAGMLCGVCLAPGTSAEVLEPLLQAWYHPATGQMSADHAAASGDPAQESELLEGEQATQADLGDREPLVDLVDVLAVSPGIGGQPFDMSVLDKVRRIHDTYQRTANLFRSWNGASGESAVDERPRRIHRTGPWLRYLAVDGGVNDETAPLAAEAGANVLIAGSSVFGRGRIRQGRGRDPAAEDAVVETLRDRINALWGPLFRARNIEARASALSAQQDS